MSDKTTEKGNVRIEGAIDSTFRSYGVPSQEEVEKTEYATEENGSEQTEFWPSEAPDPDDLTEQQEQAIRLAAENPTLSCDEIDERLNTTKYTAELLRRHVPEWYNDVFKKQEIASKGNQYTNQPDDMEIDESAIPPKVDVDDLTPKQLRTLEVAYANPDYILSDIADTEGTVNDPGRVLRERCPEWYETVFKTNGNSRKGKAWADAQPDEDHPSESEPETDSGPETDTDTEESESFDEMVDRIRKERDEPIGPDESDREGDRSVDPHGRLAEIESVCEYAQRFESRESELATHILGIING